MTQQRSDDSESRDNKQNDSTFYARGIRYSSLVFEFVGMILIFGYIGRHLDQRYGWNSWGMLAGLLLGMGLGLWCMIRQLDKMDR